MTISELIKELEKIKAEHGDISVRKLEYDEWGNEGGCCHYYEDITEAKFTTDKDEPQTGVNPYEDGFVVLIGE